MKSSGQQLVLVPGAAHRAAGWVAALLGIVAVVLSGKAGSAPLVGLVAAAGLAAVAVGLDSALMQFAVTPGGIQLRGLRPVRVAVAEITAVEARAAAGILGPKVRIEVDRREGRPLKLTRLQRYATPEGLTATNTDVAAIRQILGGVAPERPSF